MAKINEELVRRHYSRAGEILGRSPGSLHEALHAQKFTLEDARQIFWEISRGNPKKARNAYVSSMASAYGKFLESRKKLSEGTASH